MPAAASSLPAPATGDARAAVAVFAGGCAGGLSRHLLTVALPAGGTWPWGVVVANTAGAFLLALLVGRLRDRGPAWLGPALGTGVLGAFTTMSGLTSAAVVASDDDAPSAAVILVLVSAVAGLMAAVAGLRTAGRR